MLPAEGWETHIGHTSFDTTCARTIPISILVDGNRFVIFPLFVTLVSYDCRYTALLHSSVDYYNTRGHVSRPCVWDRFLSPAIDLTRADLNVSVF